MGQNLDPGEWERDIARAEKRVGSRRGAERRRRDRWDRRVSRGSLGLLVALYIIGFVNADHQRGELSRTKVSEVQLRDSLVQSCERTNVLRAQSNLSNAVSFKILSVSAQRERQLARTDLSDTRATHRSSAGLLAGQARHLVVTGPTDCPRAVRLGHRYKFPAAEPIGNPYSGALGRGADAIIAQSTAVLRRRTVRTGG